MESAHRSKTSPERVKQTKETVFQAFTIEGRDRDLVSAQLCGDKKRQGAI